MVITAILARYLGAADFGVLSVALGVTSILTVFASLGMDPILFKKFSEPGCIAGDLLSRSVTLRLFVSFFVINVCLILLIFFDSRLIAIVSILSIGLIFDSFLGLKDYCLAIMKNNVFALSTFLSSSCQLLLCYCAVTYDASIYWVSLIYVSSKFLQVFLLYKFLNSNIQFSIDVNGSLELLKESVPMLAASLLGVVYSVHDQFIIAYLLGDSEAGIYVVGMKIIFAVIILPTLVSNVFYPGLVKQYRHSRAEYREQLSALYSIFFLLGMAVTVFFLILADPIIFLLFGPEFKDSIDIMKTFSVVMIFAFFQSLNNKVLILEGLQHYIYKRISLGLFISSGLSFFLVPALGVIGAVYAKLVAELVIVISYSFSKETRFIFYYQLRALAFYRIFSKSFFKRVKV